MTDGVWDKAYRGQANASAKPRRRTRGPKRGRAAGVAAAQPFARRVRH